MRIPRDLSGPELVRLLKPLGYSTTRQTGSHIRLTTQKNGEHHITVPNHDPIKVGTLSAIISDIAGHLGQTKEELLQALLAS